MNASHAMPKSHAMLSVKTKSNNDGVVINIKDNGCGIAQKHLGQIFQPFFTTKEIGTGTGLGLAVSYFIMTEHHRGSLDLLPRKTKIDAAGNTIDTGTTFRISLPLADTEILT